MWCSGAGIKKNRQLLNGNAVGSVEEIQTYVANRYMGACEAAMILFGGCVGARASGKFEDSRNPVLPS